MEWTNVPASENVVEFAVLVGEAEMVLEFGGEVQGLFSIRVFEDLQASDPAMRYFARALERDDAAVTALASAPSAQEAALACVREAGVSLRRARGR